MECYCNLIKSDRLNVKFNAGLAPKVVKHCALHCLRKALKSSSKLLQKCGRKPVRCAHLLAVQVQEGHEAAHDQAPTVSLPNLAPGGTVAALMGIKLQNVGRLYEWLCGPILDKKQQPRIRATYWLKQQPRRAFLKN